MERVLNAPEVVLDLCKNGPWYHSAAIPQSGLYPCTEKLSTSCQTNAQITAHEREKEEKLDVI